jgi:hypothetical protein
MSNKTQLMLHSLLGSIESFKAIGAEVKLNRSLAAVEKNPNNAAARNKASNSGSRVKQTAEPDARNACGIFKAQFVLGYECDNP